MNDWQNGKVIDSRKREGWTYRRRQCADGSRQSTVEIPIEERKGFADRDVIIGTIVKDFLVPACVLDGEVLYKIKNGKNE